MSKTLDLLIKDVDRDFRNFDRLEQLSIDFNLVDEPLDEMVFGRE